MKHPNAIDRHVGMRLRQLRLARGMDLSELSGLLGVSTSRLIQFEEGRERISAHLLRQLAKILNVPPSEFFEGFPRSGASGTDAAAKNASGGLRDEEHRLLRDFARVRDATTRTLILALVAVHAEFSDRNKSQMHSGH